MKGEIVTVVRLPISEIAGVIAEQHKISVPLSNFRLEKDQLILSFAQSSRGTGTLGSVNAVLDAGPDKAVSEELGLATPRLSPDRRPSRKNKRHRMKTRGWEVVGKIENSYGQSARVYRPFVDALSQKGLTAAQKRAIVAKILRGNGNRPTDTSIEYYLMNTIEFLEQTQKQGEA